MKGGTVYRREELSQLTSAVDRDLKELLSQGLVKKAAPGLYYRVQQSRFGDLPPAQNELVRAFLKTEDFLLTSLNAYNGLGLGLTQLTNEMLVYNRKRIGKFKLGGLVYHFKRPINFPKKASEEFLVVDLLNNYDDLPDPSDQLWSSLQKKVNESSQLKLQKAAVAFGKAKTLKILKEMISSGQ